MKFKKAETASERLKLMEIPEKEFIEIGHKPDDYELDYESFRQHQKEVRAYLEANKWRIRQ